MSFDNIDLNLLLNWFFGFFNDFIFIIDSEIWRDFLYILFEKISELSFLLKLIFL